MNKYPLALTCLWLGASPLLATPPLKLETISIQDTPEPSPHLTTLKPDSSAKAPINLTRLLQESPFLTLKKSSPYNSEPYIRGRATNGVPLYIEGMRLNAGHSDAINLFSPLDVEEISIYRGASGANLGMGAMSGGVQLHLKEPRFSSAQAPQTAGFLHADVALLATSGYATALGASIYNDRLHLSLSGKRDDFGEYHSSQGDKVPHSDSDSSGFSLLGAYKISDDSHFYARFSQNNAQSSDTLTRFKSNGIWRYTTRPDDEAKSYFIGFKKQEWQGFSELHAQFFGNDLHYDMNTKQEAPQSHVTDLFRESEMRGGRFSAKRDLSPSHINSP